MDYRTDDEQGLSPVELVRSRLKKADDRSAELDEAVKFRLSFCLDLEHYDADERDDERALDRIMPRDPGLFRVWRYKTALLLKRFPLHLRAMPAAAPGATQQELTDAARRVDMWRDSQALRFGDVRRRYVGGAMAAGAWAAELCYERDRGLYLYPRDPRRIRWEQGYLHPQDPQNPWVTISSRVPVAQLYAGAKKAGWTLPDGLKGDVDQFGRYDEQGLITVTKYYCRFEPAVKGEDYSRLDKGDYHMACQCGWNSPPASEARDAYPKGYPARIRQGCPTCGGDLGLVTAVPRSTEKPYGGKRLIICAPRDPSCTEPFVDGDWEFDYPFFPLLYLEAYPLPHKSVPMSDTKALKTAVLGSNALLRLAYETSLTSKPKWLMPAEGIENARGAIFSFDPDLDGDVMYQRGNTPKRPEIIQGQGVNSSVFAAYDRLQGIFRTNESTSELALTPSEIKDAKVGTVEQVTETGNVVIDDHGEILYREESMLFTNAAQAFRELPSQVMRTRDVQGNWTFKPFGGPTMPAVEIEAGGMPLDAIDQQDLQNYMTLVNMPPERRRGFARWSHVDDEVLQQIEQDDQIAQQRARQQAAMAPPGMPGPPVGPPGAGPPPMGPPGTPPGIPAAIPGGM